MQCISPTPQCPTVELSTHIHVHAHTHGGRTLRVHAHTHAPNGPLSAWLSDFTSPRAGYHTSNVWGGVRDPTSLSVSPRRMTFYHRRGILRGRQLRGDLWRPPDAAPGDSRHKHVAGVPRFIPRMTTTTSAARRAATRPTASRGRGSASRRVWRSSRRTARQ